MAKSLKLEIELAGAEEIKRQLEGVGEAGEQAFNKILGAAKEAGGFKKLDPSFLQKSFDELGAKAPEALGKITNAVKSATRMETLINALSGVENGLIRVQAAASTMDAALGKALLGTITKVARLLPAAFGAGVVAGIAVATNAIIEMDKAAIKLGVSVGDLSKAQKSFEAIGIGAKEAQKGIGDFAEKMNLERVKKTIEEIEKRFLTFTHLDILTNAAKGVGEAADLARKKLAEMGRLDTVLSPAARAIDEIKNSTKSLPDQIFEIVGVLEKMGDTAERDRLIFSNFDKDFGTRLIQTLNAGIPLTEALRQGLAGITPVTQEAANAATRLGVAWQKVKNFMASGIEVSPWGLNLIADIIEVILAALAKVSAAISAFGGGLLANTLREFETMGMVLATIGQLAMTVWNGFVQGASMAIQTVLQFFSQMPQQIAGYFAGFGSGLWDSIVQSAQAAWDKIIGFIERAIAAVRQFFGMGGGQAAGAGAQGMAHGGLMGGRGTGTSDSNLAWLSRGEHIMPARAVRQPGVLQLLEALRRSGGNLHGVLDRMGHFAMGGMVGAPAFASGGAVGGMSNVTIQFPGLAPITGLRASSAVVDELRRSAALAQVRSGGRKPSRYT